MKFFLDNNFGPNYARALREFGEDVVHISEVDEFDDDTRAVVEWFRGQVPERTLHNWQNTATRLVAQDLREMMG